MLTLKVKALAALGYRPDEDRFVRAEVISGVGTRQLAAEVSSNWHKIEDGGGEIADRALLLCGHVASHGKSLQIDLRPHDCRAEVHQDAAFQPFHVGRENQKITAARHSQSGWIQVRMLVKDVVADSHVDRYRNRVSPGRGQKTEIAIREIAGVNCLAHGL